MAVREIALDQRYALKTATARLEDQFDGFFSAETVERFLYSSYEQFADRAVAPNFLPLLAERFTKQRLQAMTRTQGSADADKPAVLFLCADNTRLSQMAMGFFNRLTGDNAIAWSGGTEPGRAIDQTVVAAMAERGVDLSREYPKPWTEEVAHAADAVITVGGGQVRPDDPQIRYTDWQLDDPEGTGVVAIRPVRNEIKRRVRALIVELDVPVVPERSAG